MVVLVWLALMVHQEPLVKWGQLDQMAPMANQVPKDRMVMMLKNLSAREVLKVQLVQLVMEATKEAMARTAAKVTEAVEAALVDQVNQENSDPMDQSVDQELKAHQDQMPNTAHVQVVQEVVVAAVVVAEALQAVLKVVLVLVDLRLLDHLQAGKHLEELVVPVGLEGQVALDSTNVERSKLKYNKPVFSLTILSVHLMNF